MIVEKYQKDRFYFWSFHLVNSRPTRDFVIYVVSKSLIVLRTQNLTIVVRIVVPDQYQKNKIVFTQWIHNFRTHKTDALYTSSVFITLNNWYYLLVYFVIDIIISLISFLQVSDFWIFVLTF